MGRTLIFDERLYGHHLEYIHHLYIGACSRKNEEFVFAVPEKEWQSVKDKRDWPVAENVKWLMLDDRKCKDVQTGSLLTVSYKLSRYIKSIALEVKADRVILISLAPVIPFLPLMLPSKIRLSGIIYKIYLRAPKKGLRGLLDKVRYTIMAKSRVVEKVFILNDNRSTQELRSLYSSDKFTALVDPVPEPSKDDIKDKRKELDIPESSTVYLHFGSMTDRKGTLDILQAILLLSKELLSSYNFIFAGKVSVEIKEEFYSLVAKARKIGANIIVKDEFCSYNYLFSLCYTCDCILMPYKLTDLSSGVLGYAAIFQKPVIGPSAGLIGDIIKEYGLGQTIDEITPDYIKTAISVFTPHKIESNYALTNTTQAFVDKIYSVL